MNRDAVAPDRDWRMDVGSVASVLPDIETSLDYRRKRIAWGILFAAIALTVLEGAIRKWVLGSASQIESYLIYFSKDIVFALLLFLPVRRTLSAPLEYFRQWLIPACFLLICGALGSSTQEINFGGAILTLRAAVFLPVIAFLVAPRLAGLSLYSVALFIGFLTIVNFVLGVVQNQLPATHMINRYVAETTDITATVTGVRATGTFSYITGMATLSVAGIWAGLVQLSLGVTLRQQVLGWAIVASGFGCGLASISRGPIFMGAVLIFVWLFQYGHRMFKQSVSIIAATLLLVLLAFIGLTENFSHLGHGLWLRVDGSAEETQGRAFGPFAEALKALEMAPFGNGLGTEQVGRDVLKHGELAQITFESQLPRILLETGVLGLTGFVVLCAGALLGLQVCKMSLATSGEKASCSATQLFLLLMFTSNVVFNHVASAFTWTIFAAVLASVPAFHTPTHPYYR